MKKLFVFFVLGVFVISLASARSLDISIDKKILNFSSDLNIDYSINFDEVQKFSYEIGIKGNGTFPILNKTVMDDHASGQIIWNTKNFMAGTYEAYLFIYPSTYWPSGKFEILPYMNFGLSTDKLDVFVYGKSATKSFEIKNEGNVPIFVSLSPKGLKSEASFLPLTSKIGVNNSVSFLFSVEKPKNHDNATLTVEASWGNQSSKKEMQISVYNPIVVIEADNLTLKKQGNSQVVKGIILNKGNVYRDISLAIHLEDSDKNEKITLNPNKSFELNYTFPKDAKVKSLDITYINSDGKEATITKNFGLFSGISLFGNPLILLGGIIILILILYALFKLRKPKDIKVKTEDINLPKGK